MQNSSAKFLQNCLAQKQLHSSVFMTPGALRRSNCRCSIYIIIISRALRSVFIAFISTVFLLQVDLYLLSITIVLQESIIVWWYSVSHSPARQTSHAGGKWASSSCLFCMWWFRSGPWRVTILSSSFTTGLTRYQRWLRNSSSHGKSETHWMNSLETTIANRVSILSVS